MRFLTNPFLWLMLAIALFIAGSGAVGFVGPDEPRYADVARAMLQSGDYVTPRLFGSPWFEKPPLYYWLEAFFFRLGINELDARLPSALSACAFIGVWFWFSRRLFGTRAAALACILLASTVGWIGFAHAAVMDMLLSATLDAALLMLALWFWEKEETHLYVFYTLLGLATLAKGPVAVVLAGLIALAYIATYREWKAIKDILYTPALALFVVVAVPWYLLCYGRNGYPFIKEFFLIHNLGRFASTALGHGQPLWYYLPILAAGFFPWTPLLLLPLAEVLRAGPRTLLANRRKTFLLYWTILPFVFFSLAQNKLPGYLLPILPPLSLWIAEIMEGEKEDERSKESPSDRIEAPQQKRPPNQTVESAPVTAAEGGEDVLLQELALWLVGLSALALFVIPVLASFLGEFLASGLRHALAGWTMARLQTVIWKGPVPPAVLLFLLLPVGFSLFLLWRRSLLEGAFLVMVGVAMCMMGIVQYLAPSIDRVASVRFPAQRLQALGISGEEMAVYRLPRNQYYGLSYYADRALPEWSPPASPASAGYVISKDEELLPDAQSRTLFPGPHLRVWALPPSEFEIRIQEKPRQSP
jgi:hypothetical protein